MDQKFVNKIMKWKIGMLLEFLKKEVLDNFFGWRFPPESWGEHNNFVVLTYQTTKLKNDRRNQFFIKVKYEGYNHMENGGLLFSIKGTMFSPVNEPEIEVFFLFRGGSERLKKKLKEELEYHKCYFF